MKKSITKMRNILGVAIVNVLKKCKMILKNRGLFAEKMFLVVVWAVD